MKNNVLYSCLLAVFLFSNCQKEEVSVANDSELTDGSIGFIINQNTKIAGGTRAADNIHIGDSCFISVDVEPIPDNTLNPNPQTRASLIDATTLTSIGVTGYYTKGGYFNSATSKANFLVNEKVWKDGSTWKYTNIKFWPSDGSDRLSFFAYAPFFEPVAGAGEQTTSFDFATWGDSHINLYRFSRQWEAV